MALAKNNYNKEKLVDRFCGNSDCEEVINVRNKKVRFCSDKCRIYQWRKLQREKKIINNKNINKK